MYGGYKKHQKEAWGDSSWESRSPGGKGGRFNNYGSDYYETAPWTPRGQKGAGKAANGLMNVIMAREQRELRNEEKRDREAQEEKERQEKAWR